MSEEKRYAMLIDSDNVSAKYIDTILDELAAMGVVTVRRIYGDWGNCVNGWNKSTLLNHSIVPIHQYAYTTGKNSTDSAMIIDAMDLLYAGNVDGFCLVSSDSDFTRLAVRLREAGKDVIGMGEKKTPDAFVKACTSFKILDALLSEDMNIQETDTKKSEHDVMHKEVNGNSDADLSYKGDCKNSDVDASHKEEHNASITSIKSIKKFIYDIIDRNADNNKKTHLGEIGSRLQMRFPDFDIRNYGYSKLTTFLEDAFDCFVVIINNRQNYVEIKDNGKPKAELEEQICMIILKSANKSCNMGQLNQQLKEIIPGFSIKKYGYSKFSSFLKSFASFKIDGSVVTMKT